ncbi:hypothetical protein [Synechococcus sp. PCC 7336]|uniref:hypothetical protein n=1 Tax=Synechococcus sp. PCC 7336 TaxID=195250 RepID=UPI00034C151F|nr:hypothetical protein [Synechococcus sp. PCC 7336]
MQITRNLLFAAAAIASATSLLAAAPASATPPILLRLQELRSNATINGGIDSFTPTPSSRSTAVEVASNDPAASLSEKSKSAPLLDRLDDLRTVEN